MKDKRLEKTLVGLKVHGLIHETLDLFVQVQRSRTRTVLRSRLAPGS